MTQDTAEISAQAVNVYDAVAMRETARLKRSKTRSRILGIRAERN